MTPSADGRIVLAGATGDLGGRIAESLGRRSVAYRALVRPGTAAAAGARLEALGATVLSVAYDDAAALTNACRDASCVVSALNGLEATMIGMQGVRCSDVRDARGEPIGLVKAFACVQRSVAYASLVPPESDARARADSRTDQSAVASRSSFDGSMNGTSPASNVRTFLQPFTKPRAA